MSTGNYIQIYDDNVVKFSIKQGYENDRWPITGDYKIEQSNTYTTILKYKNNNSSVTRDSSTMPGAFTIAELACTRDTNRVFVGNFSNELHEQQQTVGGSLAGNKYLGFVDSKPILGDNADTNAIPKTLSSSNNNGLLETNSTFRSYNHIKKGEEKTCEATEDGMWSKQAYYNSKYDAYDGDYMYDIYRNALILFDHNIKPSTPKTNGTTVNTSTLPTENTPESTRRITPLIPYNSGDDAVKKFTSDMYGDGYVLLYNVVPDGDTLTFSPKKFTKGTGVNANNPGNYSQNIIKLNRIPTNLMIDILDGNFFILNESGKITLQNVSGGGGGGDISDIDILKDYSLRNIYNTVVEPRRLIVSDDNGYILKDSRIPTSLFTGINTNIALETRLQALESGGNDGDYATVEDLRALERKVDNYHSSSGSTEADSGKIELFMTKWRASKILMASDDQYINATDSNGKVYEREHATADNEGNFIMADAIKKGCLLLDDTKRIKIDKDGYIIFSASNGAGGLNTSWCTVIKLYLPEHDSSIPIAICRMSAGDTGKAGGCSCTIPVYADETYEFCIDKKNNWETEGHLYLAYYIF